ncbi:MAG: hypothetical protein ABJP70_09460 [Erythrobacter sp.]
MLRRAIANLAVVFAVVSAASQPTLAEETAALSEGEAEAAPEQSLLLVELLGPAKMIGFPAVCPGSSPEDDQSDMICLAELYEAPARVIKTLDGVKTKRRLNIRFTAHSAYVVWKKDRRFVLSVVPFEDEGRTGHFAWFWDYEEENGEFCVGNEGLENADASIRDFYRSGHVRKASRRDENWEHGYEIACTQGQRRWRLNG